MKIALLVSILLFPFSFLPVSAAEELLLEFPAGEGPGSDKHIVLISGDEEYRSEEALPQLARILSRHHGFRCTVLFAIDPERKIVQPNVADNIPALEKLESADLMVIFTRFRRLPTQQMNFIDAYLKAGKPVIGIRTATHAFRFDSGDSWNHYSNGYEGPRTEWTGGFGRLILGEKWVSHHGRHKHESTRGIIAPAETDHPIVRGLAEGSIWGPSDVYTVRLPLTGDSRPLVLGQVLERPGAYDESDPFYGMSSDDGPPVPEKNDPMMPIAWTKSYRVPGGETGRAFTSTIGASTDLVAEGTRRLLVNAVYWCLGMEDEIPREGTAVDLVGEYRPTAFQFHEDTYWIEKALRPSDFARPERVR